MTTLRRRAATRQILSAGGHLIRALSRLVEPPRSRKPDSSSTLRIAARYPGDRST